MSSKVLLPLYIYPHPNAWSPLYTAYVLHFPPFSSLNISSNLHLSIESHPALTFLIVINPNNGPGSAPWWPNEDYVREIPRLNSYPNVQLLGYVRATYCKRELCDIFEDVQTYAARGRDMNRGDLAMKGIFVDETVNLYSEEMKHYLDRIDGCVRGCEGIGGDKVVRLNLSLF